MLHPRARDQYAAWLPVTLQRLNAALGKAAKENTVMDEVLPDIKR